MGQHDFYPSRPLLVFVAVPFLITRCNNNSMECAVTLGFYKMNAQSIKLHDSRRILKLFSHRFGPHGSCDVTGTHSASSLSIFGAALRESHYRCVFAARTFVEKFVCNSSNLPQNKSTKKLKWRHKFLKIKAFLAAAITKIFWEILEGLIVIVQHLETCESIDFFFLFTQNFECDLNCMEFWGDLKLNVWGEAHLLTPTPAF